MIDEKVMSMLMVTKDDLVQAAEEIVKMTMAKMEKEHEDMLVTGTQVCNLLGVSSPTLWRWAKTGYLVPIKIGSKTMYNLSDVERIKGVRK